MHRALHAHRDVVAMEASTASAAASRGAAKPKAARTAKAPEEQDDAASPLVLPQVHMRWHMHCLVLGHRASACSGPLPYC